MIWMMQNWKIFAGMALIAIVYAVGHSNGVNSVQQKWDAERTATAIEMQEAMVRHAAMILTLEVQHDKNNATIDRLAADNKRLHLQPTACSGLTNPGGGTQASAGGGALHTDPSEIVGNYSEEVGQLFAEADKVVEQCRVGMEYLKALKVE